MALTALLSGCSGDFETVSKAPQDDKRPSEIAAKTSKSAVKNVSGFAYDKPLILKKESRQNGCDILVRYPNVGERALRWEEEVCNKLTISISSTQDLKSINQLEDVAADAITDMNDYNQKGFVLIESEFTMSAFILNSGGKVYEVPLAD